MWGLFPLAFDFLRKGCCFLLDRHLISYCSPTLASLKAASLFRLSYSCQEELDTCIASHGAHLAQKGVSITILRQSAQSALIYVYREKTLLEDLQKPGVSRFLQKLGYDASCAQGAVARLRRRLALSEDFPHEIGLFLGYPLWDVCGFIHYKGKNCKCCGHWKVYYRKEDAEKMFRRFNQCRHVYQRLWESGKSVLQLTVSA